MVLDAWLIMHERLNGHSPCNCTPQAFKRNIEYKLAGQTTGGILRLVLANTTYVSNPAYNSVGAKVAPTGSTTKQQTHKEWR